MTILDLQPKEVWRYFDEISRIPRGSGNEAAVREHIIEFAKVNGLYYKVDDAGNLILRKAGDATKGKMLLFQAGLRCHNGPSGYEPFHHILLVQRAGWTELTKIFLNHSGPLTCPKPYLLIAC